MKKIIISLILITTLFIIACKRNSIKPEEELSPTPTSTPIEKIGYSLFWHDEFNSDTLDTSIWNAENIKWPWSNELEYYTPREKNLKVENGNLVIIARKENYNGAEYTSARINTKGKIESNYGYIEAKIKLPYGQGIWPAFWLFMEPNNYPSYYGEIDIMEMIGGGPGRDNVVYGTCHWGDPSINDIVSDGGQTYILWPEKLSDDYHIYAIEWTDTYIKWFFDGQNYYTVSITDSEKSELKNPQYIIFNIAVGGDWPGNPDSTTVFPQYMYVDWVRWWKKN